jgi:hypothetical protein
VSKADINRGTETEKQKPSASASHVSVTSPKSAN